MTNDNTTTEARKTGRPLGSRTRPKPDVMDMMRADALIALHSIYNNPNESAKDRIDAAGFLLLLPRITGLKGDPL